MSSPKSNYVAAWVDWGRGPNQDKVVVLERTSEGHAKRVVYNSPYYFYYEDPDGEFVTIFDNKVSKAEFATRSEFKAALEYMRNPQNFDGALPKLFETDIAPLKRVLMENYYGVPAPNVNYALIDIETNYTREGGFPAPTNAYAIINAVTIYQSWTEKFLTYAVPPDNFTGTVDDFYVEYDRLIKNGLLRPGIRPEFVLCDSEATLIMRMIAACNEADILCGWNSEFYDLPYIYERLMLMGGESLVAKLEYPGAPLPKKEMANKFGTEEPVIKMTGKSHLDYLRLFQKFTFEGRVSYSLGNILQEEVGIGKIDFDGTLEQLYKGTYVPPLNNEVLGEIDSLEKKQQLLARVKHKLGSL
jgi:DNA polymerase elongation subunit (family B)